MIQYVQGSTEAVESERLKMFCCLQFVPQKRHVMGEFVPCVEVAHAQSRAPCCFVTSSVSDRSVYLSDALQTFYV